MQPAQEPMRKLQLPKQLGVQGAAAATSCLSHRAQLLQHNPESTLSLWPDKLTLCRLPQPELQL